jgi:putative flippase GtrA
MSRTKLKEKSTEPEAPEGPAQLAVSNSRSPAHVKHGTRTRQAVKRAGRRSGNVKTAMDHDMRRRLGPLALSFASFRGYETDPLGRKRAPLEKPPGQLESWIVDTLERWSWTLRFAKFAMATGTGFLINQTILAIGILAIYHTMSVPGLATSSLVILGLDLLALGTGDTVAFMINERVTVKNRTSRRSRFGVAWLTRWLEYQITAMMGNLIIVTVQIVLLVTLALSPLYGEVAGAIVSYPTTYIISMRLVWRVHPFSR